MVQLMHYKAVNLARRLSVKNENDLLQESLYDDDVNEKITYTKDLCAQIAQRMIHASNLPIECMKYDDIVKDVKSHEKDMSHPTSWMI